MTFSTPPLSSMLSPAEGYLHIAEVFFWPFAPLSNVAELQFDATEVHSTPTKNAVLVLFEQWVRDSEELLSPSPGSLPSPAALRIFDVIHAHHNSVLHLHIKAFSQGYCQLNIAISRESLATVGELVRPSDALRGLFWHVVQRQDPRMPVPSCNRDACGFVGCAAKCLPVPNDHRIRFHLDHVFEKCTRPSAVDDIGATLPGFTQNRTQAGTGNPLISMPEDVLLKVVLSISQTDRVELAAVSLDLGEFLAAIVPGLKTRLFPHQLHALARISDMEAKAMRNRPVPLLHRLEVRGLPTVFVVVDLVDGSVLRVKQMPFVAPPRGGLYCDEPGLGKTVTALAMVLRTLGQVPEVPNGYQTFVAEYAPSLKVYFVPLAGRFCSYGDDLVRSRTRRSRLLPDVEPRRSSLRRVIPPNYFQEGKGQGSVPDVHKGASWESIYVSHATMVVVPDVLTEHWLHQICLNVQTNALSILHIKSADDLPDTLERLALDFDVVLISFEVIARLYSAMREDAPMLMRVHFLRVIVDEGHFLSSANITRFASVCNRIRAERRWVMTGTPTRSNLRISVDHLQHLLKFLRDEAYGLDRKAWMVGIRKPYAMFQSESLDRLGALLCNLMIRADKSILGTACEVKTVIIEFSKTSANVYNRIVEFVRRNLICAGWYDENHPDSLLNHDNLRFAREVVGNLRIACCLEGTADVNFSEQEVMHTLDTLYLKFGRSLGIQSRCRFDDPQLEPMREDNRISAERKLLERLNTTGKKYLRLPGDMELGNISSRKKRIYCGILYEIGHSLLIGSSRCARCLRSTLLPLVTPCGHLLCNCCILLDNMKCTAPNCGQQYKIDKKGHHYELMQLQGGALSKGAWKVNLDSSCSEKVGYLIDRIESLLAPDEGTDSESDEKYRPPKIIVHSQHVDHLRLVAIGLQRTRFMLCYTELNMNLCPEESDLGDIRKASEYAQASISKFSRNPEIFILLMNTRLGSVGLDLSFVEHIFLLEPVWDRSVELQVISRAHRIGSTRNVYVERLVMRDSIEHDMVNEMNLNPQYRTNAGFHVDDVTEVDLSRIRKLLRNLKPVRYKEALRGKRRQDSFESEGNESRRVRFK